METIEKSELDAVKLMKAAGKKNRYMSDENGSIAFASKSCLISLIKLWTCAQLIHSHCQRPEELLIMFFTTGSAAVIWTKRKLPPYKIADCCVGNKWSRQLSSWMDFTGILDIMEKPVIALAPSNLFIKWSGTVRWQSWLMMSSYSE